MEAKRKQNEHVDAACSELKHIDSPPFLGHEMTAEPVAEGAGHSKSAGLDDDNKTLWKTTTSDMPPCCYICGFGLKLPWSFKQDRMELAYGCWGGSHKYLAYDNIERLEMTKPGGCCKCCAAGQVTFYTNKKSHLSGGLSMRTKQAKKVARMVVPGITAQALRHRTPAASRSPSPPPSARVNSVAPVAL